jgi:hypothetical protein
VTFAQATRRAPSGKPAWTDGNGASRAIPAITVLSARGLYVPKGYSRSVGCVKPDTGPGRPMLPTGMGRGFLSRVRVCAPLSRYPLMLPKKGIVQRLFLDALLTKVQWVPKKAN